MTIWTINYTEAIMSKKYPDLEKTLIKIEDEPECIDEDNSILSIIEIEKENGINYSIETIYNSVRKRLVSVLKRKLR